MNYKYLLLFWTSWVSFLAQSCQLRHVCFLSFWKSLPLLVPEYEGDFFDLQYRASDQTVYNSPLFRSPIYISSSPFYLPLGCPYYRFQNFSWSWNWSIRFFKLEKNTGGISVCGPTSDSYHLYSWSVGNLPNRQFIHGKISGLLVIAYEIHLFLTYFETIPIPLIPSNTQINFKYPVIHS